MRPIRDVARDLGLAADEAVPFGPSVLKVPVAVVRRRAEGGPKGRLVLVTAMTPTSHGEGKTVVTIGLAMALRALGHRAVACLRQPSLGPVFGVKGGAAGGGRSTVEPSDAINLGLTGDLNAIANAHNLVAALLDNHIYHGNELGIRRESILWPRTLDVDDRSLRHVVVSAGGGARDVPRESRFLITAASELTAVHGLTRDYADLTARIERIVLAATEDGRPLRVGDLRAVGAAAALMRDSLAPNLVQAQDGTPALVHGGPFANIAHGTASRLSLELGRASAEFTVVEAGFASELGAEKFIDIVARAAGLPVDCAVLVATLRGLRRQGGVPDTSVAVPDLRAVREGLANLEQHVANLRALDLVPLLALNRFPGDGPEEIAEVERFARDAGIPCDVIAPFTEGAAGATALASHVVAACEGTAKGRPLYPPETGPVDALREIARRLYGAKDIVLSDAAKADLAMLERWGELAGPVCVAKTPLSLTEDPKRVGRPTGFSPEVRHFARSAGAGFTVAFLGNIETMPGLPKRPLAESIALQADGQIVGVH
jgi:formate--tetrahydrofolate ligase